MKKNEILALACSQYLDFVEAYEDYDNSFALVEAIQIVEKIAFQKSLENEDNEEILIEREDINGYLNSHLDHIYEEWDELTK